MAKKPTIILGLIGLILVVVSPFLPWITMANTANMAMIEFTDSFYPILIAIGLIGLSIISFIYLYNGKIKKSTKYSISGISLSIINLIFAYLTVESFQEETLGYEYIGTAIYGAEASLGIGSYLAIIGFILLMIVGAISKNKKEENVIINEDVLKEGNNY